MLELIRKNDVDCRCLVFEITESAYIHNIDAVKIDCEGVELMETARFLLVLGCVELQGYYYYRPMPEESFEEVLKES